MVKKTATTIGCTVGQSLSVIPPAAAGGRVAGGRGPFRLTVGPAGPAVLFASAVSVPWRGGLAGALEMVSELVGDESPGFYRPAVDEFDRAWAGHGGDVRLGLAVAGDELFGWSIELKTLLVPRGWRCDECGHAVTDAVRSISHRARRPDPRWNPDAGTPPAFVPATICSAGCLRAAVEHVQEAEQCHDANKAVLARVNRLYRRRLLPTLRWVA